MRHHRQRPDGARRHEHDVDGARRRCGRWRSPARTVCRSCTSSSRAAPTSPTRARSSCRAGRAFRDLTGCRRPGIPTVAIVFGNSTAGGAYVPGMCDYVVMIEQRSKVFLGGPPLVKMATGEESDDESLGGADMHARVSRPGRLLRHRRGRRPAHRPPDRPPPQPPQARPGARGLGGTAAPRPRAAARHPVGRPARAVRPPRRAGPRRRRQRVRRVQAPLRPSLVTGFASSSTAIPIGILANHRGVLFNEESNKAAQFIQLANQIDTPLRVPPEHDRLHGRQGVRAARDRQGRLEDDQRRQQLPGAPPHRQHGRQLRGRELRHVRPGVRAAVPVHVAQREDRP